jgi:hypothetical protein
MKAHNVNEIEIKKDTSVYSGLENHLLYSLNYCSIIN